MTIKVPFHACDTIHIARWTVDIKSAYLYACLALYHASLFILPSGFNKETNWKLLPLT